jgi:hypothetical protein
MKVGIKSCTQFVAIVILCFTLTACGNKKKYNGDSRVNYPDIKLVLDDYLDTEAPLMYNKYVNDNGSKDSSKVPDNEMPWKDIYATFEQANIQEKELDKKYIIDITNDTTTQAMTLHYTALDPNLFTQKISIISNNMDRDLRSLYIETTDPGWFSSTNQRLLFIPDRSIQIQERTKRLFSEEKIVITTYKFSK